MFVFCCFEDQECNFRYYMCSKCNKPYFGGMRRCEQNMEEEREFNPADLVRLTCESNHFVLEMGVVW